jgi:hypothetical protein
LAGSSYIIDIAGAGYPLRDEDPTFLAAAFYIAWLQLETSPGSAWRTEAAPAPVLYIGSSGGCRST